MKGLSRLLSQSLALAGKPETSEQQVKDTLTGSTKEHLKDYK